jgi:hypothetical protein
VNYLLFTTKNEDGDAALILFPIFVSILIIVAMGAVEFTNYFVASQRVAYLAREASNLALTKCWDVIYQEQNSGLGSNTNTLKCLDDSDPAVSDVKKEILDLGQEFIKNFNKRGVIKIHVWIGSSSSPGLEFVPPQNYTSGTNNETLNTDPLIKFNATPPTRLNTVEAREILKKDAEAFHRIAVAEVFYTYVPATPLNKIMGLTLPREVYETSVF